MKAFFCISSLVLALQPSLVLAYPSVGADATSSTTPCPYSQLQDQIQTALKKRSLSDRALTQPIDVTGEHEFQPPNLADGDQRGPCPGLNALANHGYIPRNGVVSMAEAISAINQVYGMGIDLATVLAIMGTVFVGNPLSLDPSFSIEGPDPAVHDLLGDLFGLLGTPQGLVGSHNLIEADSSNTRDDLYSTGDNFRLQLPQFEEWMSSTSADYFTLSDMAARAEQRFKESVGSNPFFYYGPFTGLVARNAGYAFPIRMMSNFSSENPNGVLTKEIVKSFFAISTNADGTLSYTEGNERIPANWYRTPVEYTIPALNLDLVSFVLQYPELGAIGGNTGTVNSFTGIDLTNLTGGVFDATTLLQGNNLMCFALQLVKTASPNFLSGIYQTVEVPLQLIVNALDATVLSLSCPAMADLTSGGTAVWDSLGSLYPGVSKSGGRSLRMRI